MNIDITETVEFFLLLEEEEIKHKIILMTINMSKDKMDIGRKKIRGIAEKKYHMHHVSNMSWILTFVQQFWTN